MPELGSTAAAGSPSLARCAGVPLLWLVAISTGGRNASGAGKGVEPAAGAAMYTASSSPGWTSSSSGPGAIGTPTSSVSITMPSPPSFVITG